MHEASLRRLRTDTIDLYQLHRLDPEVPMADQLGTLAELRQEGEIRHIGLDTVTAGELARALELAPIASVQNRYNVLDRESEPVPRMCEERGLAFLPWFPLGDGALTATDGRLAEVARRLGATSGSLFCAEGEEGLGDPLTGPRPS